MPLLTLSLLITLLLLDILLIRDPRLLTNRCHKSLRSGGVHLIARSLISSRNNTSLAFFLLNEITLRLLVPILISSSSIGRILDLTNFQAIPNSFTNPD